MANQRATQRVTEITKGINAASEELNADIIAYFGDVSASGAEQLCSSIRARRRRKNALLMMATYGGDPNAAYRIARQIQKSYGTRVRFKDDDDPQFWCFIPTMCKSAGTIIAIGADKLIVSHDAELGPIDPQHRKQDEVGERVSGLTPAMALSTLHGNARAAFVEHFSRLRFDTKLLFSTKLAAEIASSLSIELLKPIFEQIDPMRLAEMERSLKVAAEYGRRLNVGNLKDSALEKLLSDYPSHGFQIDVDEMAELFVNVDQASPQLEQIAQDFRSAYNSFIDRDEPFVHVLSNEPPIPEPEPAATTGEKSDRPKQGASNGQDDGQGPGASDASRQQSRRGASPGKTRSQGG